MVYLWTTAENKKQIDIKYSLSYITFHIWTMVPQFFSFLLSIYMKALRLNKEFKP